MTDNASQELQERTKHIQEVVNAAFGPLHFEPGDSGRHNDTWLASHEPGQVPRYVLKIPHTNELGRAVYPMEAWIMQRLADTQALPVHTPSLHAAGSDRAYLLMDFIDDIRVRRRAIPTFSPQERYALGASIGAFVAHMAGEISLADYRAAGPGQISARFMEKMSRLHELYRPFQARGFSSLAILTEELSKTFALYQERPQAERRLVGHNDLSPSSYLFTRPGGQWHLNSVIDFGNTQPSTPERELRFVALLGQGAMSGAVEAYQENSGESIDVPLLRLWALGTAVGMSEYALRDYGVVDPQLQDAFAHLAPELDWSELTS